MKNMSKINEDNFETIFKSYLKTVYNNLRVGTLAMITNVNTDRTINVQPVVKELRATQEGDKFFPLAEILNIPYIKTNNKEPKINDIVLCVHLDRSIKNFNLNTTKLEFIDSNSNRHSLGDCVAILGLSNNEIVINYDNIDTNFSTVAELSKEFENELVEIIILEELLNGVEYHCFKIRLNTTQEIFNNNLEIEIKNEIVNNVINIKIKKNNSYRVLKMNALNL